MLVVDEVGNSVKNLKIDTDTTCQVSIKLFGYLVVVVVVLLNCMCYTGRCLKYLLQPISINFDKVHSCHNQQCLTNTMTDKLVILFFLISVK